MAALGEARLREMEALRSLRRANEGKLLPPGPDAETKVCLCQQAPAAPMIQCELCRDAFHTSCVAAPSAPQGPRVWLCPHCRRSEKPPLEKILPLLASLQRLRVRLPEGDALRYMIERTVSWQHRARHLLAPGGLASGHGRLGSGLAHGSWQASAGQAPESSKVSPSLSVPVLGFCRAPRLLPDWPVASGLAGPVSPPSGSGFSAPAGQELPLGHFL